MGQEEDVSQGLGAPAVTGDKLALVKRPAWSSLV